MVKWLNHYFRADLVVCISCTLLQGDTYMVQVVLNDVSGAIMSSTNPMTLNEAKAMMGNLAKQIRNELR